MLAAKLVLLALEATAILAKMTEQTTITSSMAQPSAISLVLMAHTQTALLSRVSSVLPSVKLALSTPLTALPVAYPPEDYLFFYKTEHAL